MPKRVQTQMDNIDAASFLDNELVVDGNHGLCLYYNGVKYYYNGNPALMHYIDSKAIQGGDNKTSTGHYSITANTVTEENGNGVTL